MGDESEFIGNGEKGNGDVDGFIDLLLVVDLINEFRIFV